MFNSLVRKLVTSNPVVITLPLSRHLRALSHLKVRVRTFLLHHIHLVHLGTLRFCHICTFSPASLVYCILYLYIQTASFVWAKTWMFGLDRGLGEVSYQTKHLHFLLNSNLSVYIYLIWIRELQRCWFAHFLNFRQSQASCFSLLPVFMLS